MGRNVKAPFKSNKETIGLPRLHHGNKGVLLCSNSNSL